MSSTVFAAKCLRFLQLLKSCLKFQAACTLFTLFLRCSFRSAGSFKTWGAEEIYWKQSFDLNYADPGGFCLLFLFIFLIFWRNQNHPALSEFNLWVFFRPVRNCCGFHSCCKERLEVNPGRHSSSVVLNGDESSLTVSAHLDPFVLVYLKGGWM